MTESRAGGTPADGGGGPDSAPGARPGDDGMLDKVREILLGQEKQDLGRRLRAVEDRIQAALDEQRRSTLRRFEKLESRVQRELDQLTARFEDERTRRKESAAELRDQAEALLATVEKTKRDLEADKLDRFAMAEALVETAMRLSKQEPPEADDE